MTSTQTPMAKRPLDIREMMERIRSAVAPFRPAAMFELAGDGYLSLFEQLVACIISIRTYDEATVAIARRLFERARTPAAMAELTVDEISELIRPSTFYERKAAQILAIARAALDQYAGGLPCEPEVLMAFDGVGPKCAHLALGVACHQPYISVDIHVHRVTNRWGYVSARNPEGTMAELEAILPQEYWIEINRLLVPFGKHICTGTLPHCSTCPVLDMCAQVGVSEHR
jgi:endonuclease III